jgi:hypothetical protein
MKVVTFALYAYFLADLFGNQWVQSDTPTNDIDLYFPIFPALQVIEASEIR